MESMINVYKTLKKELDENYDTERSDEDFSKLVTMKDVSPDLKETLILLHSNYKTENQAQKAFIKKTMIRLIDNEIETLTKIQLILEHKVGAEGTGVTSVLHTTGLQKIIILCVLTIFAFFIMALIDKDAFKEAIGTAKDVLPINTYSVPANNGKAVTNTNNVKEGEE